MFLKVTNMYANAILFDKKKYSSVITGRYIPLLSNEIFLTTGTPFI